MAFLSGNAEITNRPARGLCGVRSKNSMKMIFKRLDSRDLIEQVPGPSRFKAAWQKKA
jgi:hypothetical protein